MLALGIANAVQLFLFAYCGFAKITSIQASPIFESVIFDYFFAFLSLSYNIIKVLRDDNFNTIFCFYQLL